MKAMVLAAGLGLRMRPLTLLKAKPALPVLNRPLIQWTLDLLAHHGVTEVVINLHHLPRTLVQAVGDGRAFGLEVAWSREPRILGTYGPAFRETEMARYYAQIMVERNATSHAPSIVEIFRVLFIFSCSFPPAVANAPWTYPSHASLFTGIHVLDPSLLDRLHEGPSDIVRDLYAPLVDEGEDLLGVRVRGAWYDLGSPALYLRSQLKMLSTGFRGLRRGPLIHPAARVHAKARVTRSIVGPRAVVGEGAEVAASVLWDRVRVGAGARVRGSILATGTQVEPRADVDGLMMLRTRRGHRLVEVA